MISKKKAFFQRWSRSTEGRANNAQHLEKVLRTTWYLFGIFPIYSSEEIIQSSLR